MNHAGFPSHLDSCSGCPSDGWPDNGRHHQIAILQRDGLYQLDRGGSIGDGGDPWRLEGGGGLTTTRTRTADAEPSPDPGGEGTGGGPYPNADSYQHGGDGGRGLSSSSRGRGARRREETARPPPDWYPYPRQGDGGARGAWQNRGGISLGLSIVPIITPLIIRPQRRSNPRRRLSCSGLIWEV